MVVLRYTEIKKRTEGYRDAASVFDKKIDKSLEDYKKELDKIENNIKKKENLINRLEVIINEIDEKRKEYDMLIKCKKVMEDDIEHYKTMNEKRTSLIADINSMKGLFSKSVANMSFTTGISDKHIKGGRLFRIF